MKNEHGVDVEQKVVTGDPAVEEPEEVEEDNSFEDLERFFSDEDEDEVEEETEEPAEEESTEEEVAEQAEEDQQLEETVEEAKAEERLFTQEELNQIIGNARIQGREVNEKVEMLQNMTGGMNLDQIIEHLKSQQVEQYESEYGLPREQAQEFIENKQVRGYLEKQLQQLHQQQQQTAAMAGYNNEKSRFISKPLVKKYEKEIDAVSQGGQKLGFEAAMNYVIGQKAVAGEITENVQKAAEQRAIKNASKKPKVTPEGAGAGGAPSQSIPPQLKQMARIFGNDPKNVARQYQKLQRTPK